MREVLSVRERERERERYRETERDGSDVTIVALKLAMNLHFPCQKIAQLAMSLHFPLPNSHFRFSLHTSRLSLHGAHHYGAEIRNEFTLSIAKNLNALFVPPLSNGTSGATSDRNPRQLIKSCPVLFCSSIEKLNQINTKNYWK